MKLPSARNSKVQCKQQCVACGRELRFFGRRDSYVYAKCKECGTIQLSPFPSREELDRAYAESYATSGHYGTDPIEILEASRPFYEAVLHELLRVGARQGRVLDFGCGWGGMCRYLRDAGYNYLGTDYASSSLDYCLQQGLIVSDESLKDLAIRGEAFSAVLMVTVFEHLQDHAEALRAIHRVLQPDGVLLILIPTAGLFGRLASTVRWLKKTDEIPAMNTTFCPPWHTAIFSLEGMRLLLASNRFELVAVRPSPSGVSPGFIGAAQRAATMIAKSGCFIFGSRWPLVLNHLFVVRAR